MYVCIYVHIPYIPITLKPKINSLFIIQDLIENKL